MNALNPFTRTTTEALEHYRTMLAQALDWKEFWQKCEASAEEDEDWNWGWECRENIRFYEEAAKRWMARIEVLASSMPEVAA